MKMTEEQKKQLRSDTRLNRMSTLWLAAEVVFMLPGGFILRIWEKKTGKEYSFDRELAYTIVLSTFFYLGLVATVLAAAGVAF